MPTKTVTTDVQEVDVDNDGDIDATVSHTTTITIEEECDPPNEPGGGTPRAGAGQACGETACWQRTPVPWTDSVAGATATLTPQWPGNIVWDFGDGSDPVMGRGPVQHTYAPDATYSVTASPVASACLKASTADVIIPI
mgnify:CR=1 FL=1|jgi:hypothetical protein